MGIYAIMLPSSGFSVTHYYLNFNMMFKKKKNITYVKINKVEGLKNAKYWIYNR